MNTLKDDDVVINLKLLKQCHIYQMFDTSRRMIFGWNVHRLCCILYIGIMQCLIIYGNLGLFFENENIDKKIDYFFTTFTNNLNIQLAYCRIIIYLYSANNVSDLFNETRFDFFTSEQCVKYKIILYNYRDKSRKYTNWYVILSIIVTIQWFIYPIAINMFKTSESSNVRFENILNLNFGVSTQTYNQYFVIFYFMEAFIALGSSYSFITIDLLLISFCSALMSQQKILVQAFKNFGYADNFHTNCIEQFKSILHDQVALNLNIKSFFMVSKQIILFIVACNSASIILLTYQFIMVYIKMEPDMIFTLLRLGSTIFYVSINLYIYCYLFDNMNRQRELVNFSLYCCNWTQMDIKFKKLLLLAMRMNDANNFVIKASPKRIVNLQIFTSIMSMSYNVLSVMVKITNTKNEISK